MTLSPGPREALEPAEHNGKEAGKPGREESFWIATAGQRCSRYRERKSEG